jgi:hypothetical protein
MLGGYMAGVTVSVCFGRFFKTMPVALGIMQKIFEVEF